MNESSTTDTDGEQPKNIEVHRVENYVELRIDGDEELALPVRAGHAVQLAIQIQRAAADAKRYEQTG